MEPILKALRNKTVQDIDPNLAMDLLRFQKYVNQNLWKIIIMFYSNRTLEDVRDCLLRRTGQGRLGRAMNLVGDGENIIKCREMINNSVKYFQVCYPVYYPLYCLIHSQLYMSISLRLDIADLRGNISKIKEWLSRLIMLSFEISRSSQLRRKKWLKFT